VPGAAVTLLASDGSSAVACCFRVDVIRVRHTQDRHETVALPLSVVDGRIAASFRSLSVSFTYLIDSSWFPCLIVGPIVARQRSRNIE